MAGRKGSTFPTIIPTDSMFVFGLDTGEAIPALQNTKFSVGIFGGIGSINEDTTTDQTLTGGIGIDITDLSGDHSFAIDDTVATRANLLSFFSTTTSSQLSTVITDDTGAGRLVFNVTPIIITPIIASFTNANHDHADAAGGGQLTGVFDSITGIGTQTQAFDMGGFNIFDIGNLFVENDATINGELTINGQTASRIGTTTFPIFSEDDFQISTIDSITEIIDSTGNGTDLFETAHDLRVDSSGTVYICSKGNDQVFKITSTGVKTVIIDSTGDGLGNILDGPHSLDIDSSGNVFVSGGVSDNVFKITSGGTITQIIDSTGDGAGNILDVPQGLVVDSSGNVYVSGRDSDNVFKITSAGAITQIIDSTGDGAGNVLNAPLGVATDSSGNVYVVGLISDNCFKITSAGAITQIIDSTGDGAGNILNRAQSIAVDSSGNVFVAGSLSNNGFKITAAGAITQVIDSTGDGVGNVLSFPVDITTDSSDNVYISGNSSDNAFKISEGTEISLTTGLYLIKDSFTMSNAINIPATQQVVIQFEDQLNTTITYSGGGIFISGVSTTAQLDIINCRFNLSGVNSEFVNLPGGNFRMFDTAVSFTGTGTKTIGTFDNNPIIAVVSSLISGYNVGFNISNVGSIGISNNFFVSDFTGSDSLFDIDSATGVIGFQSNGVFIGSTEAIFDINPTINSTIQINLINSTISSGGEFYKTGSLDQTAINVDARQTPGFPDSDSLAYGTMNSNSTPTTVTDGTYAAVDVSTITANSLTERFTLTDSTAGIWTYIGLEDFKGFLTGTLSALKTSSTANYRFAVSIDSVNPTFATEPYIPMEVKTTKVNITLEFPLSLSTGQTFQLMLAGDGTSDGLTITDTMFGAQ